MFGKAWCITNPGACNELFPYMGWAFLIAGILLFYRVYKWPSEYRGQEFIAGVFFTLLAIAIFWVINFPLPSFLY